MEWSQVSTALFIGLASCLVAIAGFMASTLFSLNEKLAVVVERVQQHDDQIKEIRIEFKTFQEKKEIEKRYR